MSFAPLYHAHANSFSSPWTPSNVTLMPLFWHIPKAAGTTVKRFGDCLSLVAVSHIRADLASGPIQILHRKVNVDVADHAGIVDASKRGFGTFLASTKSQNTTGQVVLDILMASSLLHDVAHFLLTDVRGALFTLFRHPVERAVSMFYYIQHADWEPSYRPELVNTTLIDFYRFDTSVERNWMTYCLAVLGRSDRDPSLPFGDHDLRYAKAFLEQHMLVGLTDQIDESLHRVGAYFGWHRLQNWSSCHSRFTEKGFNRHKHPTIEPGSLEWELIAEANTYDMELYDFAVRLYEKQSVLFPEAPFNEPCVQRVLQNGTHAPGPYGGMTEVISNETVDFLMLLNFFPVITLILCIKIRTCKQWRSGRSISNRKFEARGTGLHEGCPDFDEVVNCEHGFRRRKVPSTR